MIRVIHYLPSINCTSGIANLLMNYYRQLHRNKIQFHFVYFTKKTLNNFENEIESLGGTATYMLPPTNLMKFKKELNNYLFSLKEKYNDDKFVFQNHQIAFTIFMYKAIQKAGIDHFIVHNHMTKFSDSRIKSLRNMILFLLSSKKNVVYFSCSKSACNIIKKYAHVDYSQIFVMNNAINPIKFKYDETIRKRIRDKLNIGDFIVIGHIGHFDPVKNHDFIFKLFDRLYQKNTNYKLLLVGNGPLKDMYVKLIMNKKYKNNVIILSDRKDIPELLNAMDYFIFPSKFEGLGIAAIEAQASGLPTFISSYVPNEVSISNCNIISLDNIDDWENKIINSKISNRGNAYKNIQNTQFDILKNIDMLEKKYLDIVNNNVKE